MEVWGGGTGEEWSSGCFSLLSSSDLVDLFSSAEREMHDCDTHTLQHASGDHFQWKDKVYQSHYMDYWWAQSPPTQERCVCVCVSLARLGFGMGSTKCVFTSP